MDYIKDLLLITDSCNLSIETSCLESSCARPNWIARWLTRVNNERCYMASTLLNSDQERSADQTVVAAPPSSNDKERSTSSAADATGALLETSGSGAGPACILPRLTKRVPISSKQCTTPSLLGHQASDRQAVVSTLAISFD